jgi:hypothetical protein
MKSNLHYRSYRTGEEVHILELFQKSFGRKLGDQSWNWRFRDNPAGPGVIELCFDGDILVGHYAVTPIESRISGQDHFSGLSGTTMTHPDYRGGGLFPVLAQNTYARMVERGMAMVWGFPNAMSHRGFVKDLGWKDIYEIPCFRSHIPSVNPPYLPSGKGTVTEIVDFDERFDLLWDKVKDRYAVMTKRNRQYLHWRYVQNPSEKYRIITCIDHNYLLGYVVFKIYKDEIQVVDMLTTSDEDVGITLITWIIEVATKEEAVSISLWLNPVHPLHHELERLGFRNGEPVTYFGGLILNPALSENKIYDYRKWYLTMGDSDVF